jgi:hypothetical protein
MNRIFPVLAVFATLFMAATLVLGLSVGDLTGRPPDPDAISAARVHRLFGIFAAISVLLVDSIVVTYFIGTSRWCKEVAEAYRLDGRFVQQSTALKRRTFPYAVLSMLAVVGIVALGGAADPAAALRLQPLAGITWTQLHLAGSLAGLAFIAWCFYRQSVNLVANHQIIEDVQTEVRRIRLEKGLEV